MTLIWSRLLRVVEGPARQNAFGSLLIQGSQRLSRLVVVVVAAALLTPTLFAELALALALTDLVRGGLQAFDVDAVRLLSSGDGAKNVVQTSLNTKGLAGTAGIVLVGVAALFTYGPETAWLVVLSGVGAIAASFAGSFLVQRQATLALRSISPRVAAAGAGGALTGILMVWLTRSAVGGVVGMALGDGLLLALVCGADAWKKPDWREAVVEIRHCRGLLVMQLAYIGQFRVGTIVLAAVGSAVAVGEYTIASRIAEGLVILAAALTASSLPLIGAAHARNERAGLAGIFERSYSASLRSVAPLLAGIVITVPIWAGALFPRYPELGPPSAVVGLAVLIFFATSQTTALLNATHHDRAAVRSAVAGLGTSVIGSVGLASFGAVGVACARVAGELVRLLVEAGASIRDLGIQPASMTRPWLGVVPALVGTAIAVLGDWQPLFMVVGVAIVVAGATLRLSWFSR